MLRFIKIHSVLFCVFVVFAYDVRSAPSQLNYQGRLLDSDGVPVSTPTVINFSFWDAPVGGTQIAAYTDIQSVTPTPLGFFATQIGGQTNPLPPDLFSMDDVYLNISISGENLMPRFKFLSVPYALESLNSDTVDGVEGTYIVQGDTRVAKGLTVTVLSPEDNPHQIFFLGFAHRCQLPSSGLPAGSRFHISNPGPFALIVETGDLTPLTLGAGANLDATIRNGHARVVALRDDPISPLDWHVEHVHEASTVQVMYASGPFNAMSHNIHFSRTNDVVTLTWPTISNPFNTNGPNDSVNDSWMPDSINPMIKPNLPVHAIRGDLPSIGFFFFQNNGHRLAGSADPGFASWAGSGQESISAGSLSYSVKDF